MKSKLHPFGSTAEAIAFPFLLLALMWAAHWANHLYPLARFYQYGVLPGELDSLKGILLMPLIHSKDGFGHIINNSFPTAVLLGALVFYYRSIALRVFIISWICTGLGLWLFAHNTNSFHIGMSGVVYALAGFLFVSGVLRKYLPLQAISLFVAFMYGSMIWGIFPTQSHVSWEGHLSGLVTGVILAIVYRKLGPQSPKYQYEIEKELGIEPPDLEGQWRENMRLEKERQAALEAIRLELEQLREEAQNSNSGTTSSTNNQVRIVYRYQPKKPTPPDDTTPQ